jgi:RNA polymerase sigma factor (sigma-70 family)
MPMEWMSDCRGKPAQRRRISDSETGAEMLTSGFFLDSPDFSVTSGNEFLIPRCVLKDCEFMAFPTTRWTLIRQAVAEPSGESRAALEELCRRYTPPVLAFIRRRSDSPEMAEDLTQEFFARLLQGELLQRADAELGQFRSFLLHAVGNFLSDAKDFVNAKKRGGGITLISLSGDRPLEPMTHLTPDHEFEALWARTVLQRALDALQMEYQQADREPLFQSLKDQLDGGKPTPAHHLAENLHMSEGAVRVAIYRMRQRLGELIRDEVSETVPAQTDVDDELRRLRQALETAR